MKRIFGAFALLAVAASCASPEQTESLLSAAGFRAVTNSEQMTLRPYKLTVGERDGKIFYAYADPVRNQIYVGDQSQYQKYRRLKKELEVAQQRPNPPVFGP